MNGMGSDTVNALRIDLGLWFGIDTAYVARHTFVWQIWHVLGRP